MTLQESTVEYEDGGLTCRGLVIRDTTQASPQPGVVLFPDARGIGDTAKTDARRLAECGYVVFIADLYGQGLFTADIPRARELMTALRSDVDRWRERGRAALEAAAHLRAVEATKLAAIGYCFGGQTALELGRSGAGLAAIVSFHGGLSSPRPQDAVNFRARVLACHGGADPLVPPAQVTEFVSHMNGATVDWELQVYARALHGFTNPELANAPPPGHGYSAEADATLMARDDGAAGRGIPALTASAGNSRQIAPWLVLSAARADPAGEQHAVRQVDDGARGDFARDKDGNGVAIGGLQRDAYFLPILPDKTNNSPLPVPDWPKDKYDPNTLTPMLTKRLKAVVDKIASDNLSGALPWLLTCIADIAGHILKPHHDDDSLSTSTT